MVRHPLSCRGFHYLRVGKQNLVCLSRGSHNTCSYLQIVSQSEFSQICKSLQFFISLFNGFFQLFNYCALFMICFHTTKMHVQWQEYQFKFSNWKQKLEKLHSSHPRQDKGEFKGELQKILFLMQTLELSSHYFILLHKFCSFETAGKCLFIYTFFLSLITKQH